MPNALIHTMWDVERAFILYLVTHADALMKAVVLQRGSAMADPESPGLQRGFTKKGFTQVRAARVCVFGHNTFSLPTLHPHPS